MNTSIHHLHRRRRRLAIAEGSLWALVIALPAGMGIARGMGYAFWPGIAATGIVFAALFATWFALNRQRRQRPLDTAYFLNRRYPELEQSADLLLRDAAGLPPLAQYQRQRVANQLDRTAIRFPHRLPLAATALVAGGALAAAVWLSPAPASSPSPRGNGAERITTPERRPPPPLPPDLRRASVRVEPPAYARQPASRHENLDVEALTGSVIRWEFAFDHPIRHGALNTGDGRQIALTETRENTYSASLPLTRSSFYFLRYQGAGGGDTLQSDYYRLVALPDRPPGIRVEGLPAYAEYPYDPGKQVEFTARFDDDFGVAAARIVATITRGEGEAVTFRDDTLRFADSFRDQKTAYTLKKTLRLGALRMAAGDELYLHLEATDNRAPGPQTTRTAKYIIAFADPARESADMAGGLGVDRLPEYFRSQRQIIIDTEKLLAEEKSLDRTAFRERSNNIAIDQKLLRLRYGKFLGEEAVTFIGEGADPRAAAEAEHEHHDGDGHEHSGEEAAPHDHDHDHAAPEPSGGEAADLAPYAHFHDTAEEATFFDAATKTKLRAALSEMWNAELHLRLAEPRQALPYEYRALRLIKEIQQASRIYVERTGFVPPLIKVAEKRLSGDLDAVRGARLRREVAPDEAAAHLAAGVRVLEALRERPRPPRPAEYARLQAAGEVLAARALEEPGAYLAGLAMLRQVMEHQTPPGRRDAQLRELIRLCWRLLPERQRQPLPPPQRRGELRKLFVEELGG